ncbi:MAG TPA: 2-phosphosulfolactate phosphatase [candidate division Zixibacteria bacterium]|nr:2-phosphosulfolactate phosphatase [candidate division Zixibacteria bacterium]
MNFADQSGFDVRFEWGLPGLEQMLPHVAIVVIVDVLSFSTAVEAAVARGAEVLPFDRCGDEAAGYAETNNAFLAVSRKKRNASHNFSLSPVSLTKLNKDDRLVLPSPNGATLSFKAAESGITIVAGCLRNARAVAEFCRSQKGPIAIIAAGEKRDGYGGPLRPAAEDLIGSGAIINRMGTLTLSPEAEVARGAYRYLCNDLSGAFINCASGRELIEIGFESDVLFAAEIDVSSTVPVLVDRRFRVVGTDGEAAN